jgi:ADP-heptose:LPS heptosyltransferase
MKVLFVQLLRLGDVLMTEPVVRAYRAQHPDHVVDVLVNREGLKARPFIAGVRSWHAFDRDRLQFLLADPHSGIFEAHDLLYELVQKLNGERYDLVVNLTQTRLSGYLCRMIRASARWGLVLDAGERVEFGKAWFRHLNDEDSDLAPFHFNDVFLQALGVDRAPFPERGSSSSTEILVQASTSDRKKDWSNEHWARMIQTLLRRLPDHRVVLMGAAWEWPALVGLRDAIGVSERVEAMACSLEDASARLRQARALVTLDTSLKHLGVLAGLPIVEISLGSSQPYRTGPYTHRGLVIQAAVPCGPCPHRSPCGQVSHVCGEALAPESVAQVVLAYLQEDRPLLQSTVAEAGSRFRAFETDGSSLPFWLLRPLHHDPAFIERVLTMYAWRLYLNGQDVGRDQTGSESFRLAQTLSRWGVRQPIAAPPKFRRADAASSRTSQVANIVTNFATLRRERETAKKRELLDEIAARFSRSLTDHLKERSR